jgi:alcohol-forming fatty acyl-CoA reductase
MFGYPLVSHHCSINVNRSIESAYAAYVSGDREGLILEKPINPGESLRQGTYLDIDAELRLVKEANKKVLQLNAGERKAMKELGIQRARHFGWSNTYVFTKAMGEMLLGQLRGDMPVVVMRPSVITSVRADPLPGWTQGTRTIDTLIIGYAKQNLSCFLGDLAMVVDVIPGDMVVNAMMAAMMAHSEVKGVQAVYHATRRPTPCSTRLAAGTSMRTRAWGRTARSSPPRRCISSPPSRAYDST